MTNTAILDYNEGRSQGIQDIYQLGISNYLALMNEYEYQVGKGIFTWAFYRGYQDASKHID